MQGVETHLRVVPVACAEGHGHVLEPLGHHAAAHHAAKSAHEQAVDLVEGEPVLHQAAVLGHDGAGVIEVELDERGVLPPAIILGKAVGPVSYTHLRMQGRRAAP